MSQDGGELRDKRDGVYTCLFPVYKWHNLHFGSSQDIFFIEWGLSVIYAFGKCSSGEVTMIQPLG